jgi:hypothetical protein
MPALLVNRRCPRNHRPSTLFRQATVSCRRAFLALIPTTLSMIIACHIAPFMGRIVAKALSGDRLFDLRWSHVFWKLLLACCNVILKNEKTDSSSNDGWDTGSSSETSSAMPNYLAKISDADLWHDLSDGSPGL